MSRKNTHIELQEPFNKTNMESQMSVENDDFLSVGSEGFGKHLFTSKNESAKERRRKFLGICCLLGVVVMWVGSSVLMQVHSDKSI